MRSHWQEEKEIFSSAPRYGVVGDILDGEVKQLLSEPDDFELCNNLFSRILDYYGTYIEPSAYTDDERVVVLVWHVSGIIGNGGFRYLFEGNLEGDPHYSLTAAAFQATGCKGAIEAFRKSLALFPHSRPPINADERLRYFLK